MDTAKLAMLHDHYRDTCGVMQAQRSSRDRYFYFVIGVLGIVLFDVATPDGFAVMTAAVLKAQFQLASAPDLAYVRSLLWFLLLGFTIRYCQAALAVERQYKYVHGLEEILSAEIPGAFSREGKTYLSQYPLFLTWAHYLYTLLFPVLLCGIALGWSLRQIPDGWPWPFAVLFDWIITLLILVSVGLYLHALHLKGKNREEP